MEPRFFSILGLSPTREHNRSGLNDAQSHRDDEQWTLGDVPGSLTAAYRPTPVDVVTTHARRAGRESNGDAVPSAS